MTTRDQRLAALEKRMADLGEEIARIRREPEEPENLSVVRFTRTFERSGRAYHYTAVRVGDVWYLSGKDKLPSAWFGILQMADPGSLEVAKEWAAL